MTALVTVGMFDSAEGQELREIGWDVVNTEAAQQLAYKVAVSGSVLIKNNGILPLSLGSSGSYAFIGPFIEAGEQMQGIYSGPAPYLISPVEASKALGLDVTYYKGSGIDETDDSFESAIEAAKGADHVVFLGGLDHSEEGEAHDRTHLGWPAPQLKTILALADLGKPIVVVQFGGGQLDDTELLEHDAISAILWAGYPGQSGGTAILDLLFGNVAPAGRLPVTQYPTSYNEIPATDMNLRPAPGNNYLGRTYMWYNGTTPVPFGHGLHYTNFSVELSEQAELRGGSYNTEELVAKVDTDSVTGSLTWQTILQQPFTTLQVEVTNTGKVASDYVAILFQNNNAGPEPRPFKTLSAYTRIRDIQPGDTASAELEITLERLVRADENGNRVLYPGDYKLFVDLDAKSSLSFTLKGAPVLIEEFPQPGN